MGKKILQIQNLNVSFQQYDRIMGQTIQPRIHHINLNVHEGEIVAIFGESGSGKSLLAHTCLALLPQNAIVQGSVSYFGQIQTSDSLAKLRGNELSFVPQSLASLNPLLKIKKQVDRSVYYNNERMAMLKGQLKQLGLSEEVLNKYPGQLSGGMARKVLVAISLVNQPKFIIADEPTPGMDSIGLDYVVNFVKDRRQEGVGAMIISHDIQTVLRVADRIAIFYQGTIVEIAKPDQFVGQGEQLVHPYTKALWKSLPENGFQLIKDDLQVEGGGIK